LEEGLALIHNLIELLSPRGVLVIQTPNAACVRHPLSWDMTHLHCYKIADLWAYLTHFGLDVKGFRVVFGPPSRSPIAYIRFLAGAYITTRLLGCDYADNILLIAHKLQLDSK